MQRTGLALALTALLAQAHDPEQVPTPARITLAFRDPDPEVSWRMAQRLLVHRRREHGLESRQTAEALQLVARACRKRGNDQDPACLAWAQDGLGILERRLGREHADLVAPLRIVATIKLNATGELRDVERIIRRVLALQERAHGLPSAEVAQALWFLGVHYLTEYGDARGAWPHLEAAAAMQEAVAGPRSFDGASYRFTLARAQAGLGDYDAGLPLAADAIARIESARGPDDPLVARNLDTLAGLLAESGDYEAARRLLDRSLGLRRRLFGAESMEVASGLAQRGSLLVEIGDDAAARDDLREAIRVAARAVNPLVRGGPAPRISVGLLESGALLDLARIDARRGNLDAAEAGLARALGVLDRSAPTHALERARVHALRAALDRQRGRPEPARLALQEALRLREARLGPHHPLIAETLNELARVHLARGDGAAAAPLLGRSAAICLSGLGEHHRLTAETAALQAAQRRAERDVSGTLQASLHAEELRRRQVSQTIRLLSERAALGHAAARASGLDDALSLAAEGRLSGPELLRLWRALEESRGLVQREMALRRGPAGLTPDEATARLLQDLASARRRVAHLILRPPDKATPQHGALLREALQDKERLEGRWGEARGRGPSSAVASPGDPGAELPADSALVSFVEYQPALSSDGAHWLALIRAAVGPPRAVSLGPSEALGRLVDAWRREAGGRPRGPWRAEPSVADYRQAGLALRRAVWDPLLPALGGVRRVFVVPDGVLHLASLATLPADGGAYLIESGPLVHYLSSESELRGPREASRVGTLVALGGPDFDRTGAGRVAALPIATVLRGPQPGCQAWRQERFEPLAHAAAEAAEIARLWRGHGGMALELTGARADEASLRRLAPKADVLHLASHAFFVEEPCRAERREDPLLADSPLLLSGIALAGANERGQLPGDGEIDDGILTAEEVASLDLAKAGWVVLSGCETGAGDLRRGEGVVGLRRAFAAAGARTVIMSLWRVDDRATRSFMKSLYSHRLRGLATAESVRAASLEMLDEERRSGREAHPRSWGAFVAAGDWR